MNLYVATSLGNAARAAAVAEAFQAAGHTITFPWWTFLSDKDPTRVDLTAIATSEAVGVCKADVLVALLPGQRGTHFELGLAWGHGIPVVVHCETGEAFEAGTGCCSFHFLPEVIQSIGDLNDAEEVAALIYLAEQSVKLKAVA